MNFTRANNKNSNEIMSLSEFVTETLVEIAKGTNGVIDIYKDLNGCVNPENIKVTSTDITYINTSQYGPKSLLTRVDFDITLASSKSETGKLGIGVLLGDLSLIKNKKKENNISNTTRIKFSIPVILPRSNDKKANIPNENSVEIIKNRNL